MWYPTVTVCSFKGPTYAFFKGGKFFESAYPPTNSDENGTKVNSISFAPTPDLEEILHSISVNRPNGTTFHMNPSDFKNRDATWQLNQ